MNIKFGLNIANHCAGIITSLGHLSGSEHRSISCSHLIRNDLEYRIIGTFFVCSNLSDGDIMILHKQSIKLRENLEKRFGDYKNFGLK